MLLEAQDIQCPHLRCKFSDVFGAQLLHFVSCVPCTDRPRGQEGASLLTSGVSVGQFEFLYQSLKWK